MPKHVGRTVSRGCIRHAITGTSAFMSVEMSRSDIDCRDAFGVRLLCALTTSGLAETKNPRFERLTVLSAWSFDMDAYGCVEIPEIDNSKAA